MSYFRTILASIWVGWYRDFCWTNPVVGFSLKTIAPIASVMTAMLVYRFGTLRGNTPLDPSTLAYILVGATLYAHVAAYSWVPTLAIAEGKWSYVFTQVYMSPRSSTPYLAGRCLGSFVTSALTSAVSLAGAFFIVGALFNTAIPFIFSPISIALLVLALVVNVLASMGLGFMLGAYSIFATKFEWALPTYVSGLLMVFSGALFPVSVLPWPFSAIGNVLPFTEFIRASREALIYNVLPSYFYYLGLSFLGGMIFLALGLLAYRLAENRGRRLGVIDRKVV